jgi:hypothetical protein
VLKLKEKQMKRLIMALVIVILASAAFGDQLTMGKIVKDGTIQGFEKGKFRFLSAKGRFMNEQASRVTTIVLTEPKKCTYQLSSSKKEERGFFKGFNKDKFVIAATAKDIGTAIPVSKMVKLEISLDTGTSGKSGTGGEGYPIPVVDLSAFTGDFTPEQQKVMDQFKAAKKVFDDFVKENAAIVSQMDSSTGATREDYITQLRKRKIEEQPLRKALIAAYDALVNAFPEKPDEPTKTAPAAKSETKQTEQPAPPAEQPLPEPPAPDDGMSRQIQDAI